MKKYILCGIASMLAIAVYGQTAKPEWQDPAVYAVNKEPARATSLPYPTQALAMEDNYPASPYYLLISGLWKFN